MASLLQSDIPLHESNFLGFLFSPLAVLVLAALASTLIIGLVVDRLIPYSLKRHEGLAGLLIFVGILAFCVEHVFREKI
jgi:hypothetical protein